MADLIDCPVHGTLVGECEPCADEQAAIRELGEALAPAYARVAHEREGVAPERRWRFYIPLSALNFAEGEGPTKAAAIRAALAKATGERGR
jgi:hypothetical protein